MVSCSMFGPHSSPVAGCVNVNLTRRIKLGVVMRVSRLESAPLMRGQAHQSSSYSNRLELRLELCHY